MLHRGTLGGSFRRGGDIGGFSDLRWSFGRRALTLALTAGLLVPLLPQGVRADDTHSKLTVRGTITSVSVNPNLTLTLAVDKSTALPGDTLAYSGTVTHTGITACVNGSLSAQNTGGATATVAHFFDEVDYWDQKSLTWIPLAGVVNTQTAFVPVVTPRISTGITLTVTSSPANGVTYPSSGNPIVGTTIASGATAGWTGSICITLTAAQLNALFNAPKIRVEGHFEDTPGDPSGEAWTNDQECFNPVRSGFLNARNVVVTVTPPSGPPVQITSSTVPAFASLAVGASANYATTYRVPAATSRGTNETEAAYFQRLTGLEGFSLNASASVTASGPTGPVSANAPPVSTIEHLPILGIVKSGPASRDAGSGVSYQLALTNSGGATAGSLTVTDTLSDGGSGTVGNVPPSLLPKATSVATATYTIPVATQPGTLTDTAAVTWKDANNNAYGPVSGSFATRVTTNAVPPEIQPITSTTVQGNFFAEPATAQTFVAVKGDTPAFLQNFPTINFNPPAGTVPHNISGVGPQTRPFTDVTTDLVGNFAGTIPAQGGIYQAGVGPLQSFDAALQASFIVQAASEVTFVIFHDDGFILGIGNGATRVSGVYVGPPPATAFAGYPVIGAFNQMVSAPRTDEVTVHFPGAGIYPYELDYFEAGADSLTLTLTTAPAPSGSPGSTVGGVFVTGHDPDFHAFQGPNQAGAQHIIQRAIAAVTRAKANPKVLLVMDVRDPGSGSSDPRSGMTAAGFTAFDLADYGSGTAGVLDLRTVPFANYDVVVVASDFGGWLRQAELDVLNGRAGDIATYLSHGGGLVAFAESGASNLTVTGRFGFLPCLNAISGGGGESGFQLTSIGQAIGLVPTDVNSNFYHNVFASPCGMDVVDFDTAGRPVSLTSTGVSRSWNIAHDFQLAPNQANPSNGGVWSYLQAGTNPIDPTGYTKLPNFTSQAYGIAGLQQWTGTFASGGRADDMLPAAGVNASGASQHPLTFVWPNGVVRVHPWTPAVVVGWTSPFSGTVHVEGAVTHLDQSCGDGVRWNVLSGSTKLASGQVTSGALAGQFLSEGTGGASLNQISVTSGQSLYFVVDAGASGDFFCDSTALDVTVVEGPALITRPLPPATTLVIQPPSIGATVGQGVNLTVSAMDGMGAPAAGVPVTVSVSGVNSLQQTVSTDAAGLARISYVSSAAGTDLVTATANMSGRLTVSNTTTVTWTVPGSNPNLLPPTITPPSPADGTIITKPTPITAQITPPSGQAITSWSVSYQELDPLPPVTIASGTGTPPNPIATFDPTLVPNDTYAITISATASGGGTQSVTTTVSVFGNLKLGRYQATFQDLSVPVGGFQMAVRRVYDSIDKHAGDFGVGWHVELANFRVSANRQLGAGGWTEYPTSCIFGFCFYAFKTSTPHYVTVTFPDQHEEIFDFTPQGGAALLYWQGSAAFTARPGTGTTSKLEVAGDSSLSYDFAGNLVGSSGYYNPTRFKLTTRDGRVLILDTALGLVSETDPSGNAVTVDANGVHGVLGPASSPTNGPSITFTRDSQGRITDINGPINGLHYHYAYLASANELQAVTDPVGNTATYSYDPQSGNLQKSVDPNNQPIQALTYDAAGRLVSIANGSQPPTSITTNIAAQQQVILDPNGKLTTVLSFDTLGDVTERDDTFSGRTLKTVNTYDAVGRMTSSTDPLLNQARATYDESGTSADGNLLSYSDGAQRTWRFENYTSFGDPGLIRQPDGTVAETLTYDTTTAALLSTQRPGEPPTTYTYWPAGQQKSVTDPGGRIVTYAYDTNGNLSSIADSQGAALTFAEDVAGRTLSSKDQMGNLTTYTYYPSGQVSTMTDPNRHVWQYFYDARLRLHQTQDPLGASSFLDYNDLGLLRQRTDRNGQVTTYQYDVDGLMTQETRPGDVVNSRYDPLGRLVAADNSGGHSDRTYNDNSQLAGETTCASAGSANATCSAVTPTAQPKVTLSYGYWPDSQLKSVVSTDAGSVQYAYDNIGRLGSIQDPTGRTFSFGYDSFGRLASLSRPNGVNDSFTYTSSSDLAGRDASFNGSVVARFDYGIDPITGRRTSMTDTQGTHSFGYFPNGSLRSETHPTGSSLPTQTYGFDPAGNRTSWAGVGQASYNAADRLQSDGINNYIFDAEGNLTSRTPVAGGAGTTYDWNADHQLLAIHYPNGTSSSYRYDPFGRRVASQDAAQQTRFVYNGLNVHADYGSQNQLQTSYVTSLDVGSALEAVSSGGQASYYVADGLGSVRALSDSSGATAGNYQYGAFGQPSSTNPAAGRYTFTGYQYDAASGLYYAGVRYYDPSIGRFLSEDPVPSTNPYPYAVNDPVNFIDLLGMQAAGEYAINTTRNTSTIAAVERVAQGLCAAYNKAALAASGASAALNAGPTTVYQSVDEAGKVQYAGITNDVPRRAGEHFRGKGINIEAIPGLNKLSRPMARAVEQVLINRYGTLKAGGQLLNAANSVGKANPLLGAALECGQALLGAAGYL